MGNQKSKKARQKEKEASGGDELQKAHVGQSTPDLLMTPVKNSPPKPQLLPSSSRTVMRVMFSFQKQQEGDMTIKKDDILELIDNSDEFWWKMYNPETNEVGFVPFNYVQPSDGGPTSMAAWFDVDRREAERNLMMPGLVEGTFLLRPSRRRAGPDTYGLSIRANVETPAGKEIMVMHYLVKVAADKFYLTSSKTFASMQSLVRHYQSSQDGLCCRLTIPCPRNYVPPANFRDFEINRSQLTMIEKLGNGCFGEVWKARFGRLLEVAVKMRIPNGQGMTANQQDFIREAETMRRLHHPKIVQLLGVCTLQEPFYIITELMPNGALRDYLTRDKENGRTITFAQMLDMMFQIADGMAYLEEKKFVHRDLRAANILVGHLNVVKVADFGLSRLVDEGENNPYVATKFPIRWTAPEVATSRTMTTKSDVWSFGVLIYEIVTRGATPYPTYSNTREVMDLVLRGYRMANPHNEALGIQCDEFLYRSVMLACWSHNPTDRPTFVTLGGLFESYETEKQKQYA